MSTRRHWLRVVATRAADWLSTASTADATGLDQQAVDRLPAEDVRRIAWARDEVRYRLLRIGGPR